MTPSSDVVNFGGQCSVHHRMLPCPVCTSTPDMSKWGGQLRPDWPPTTESIISCPSCGMRHGKLYMCAARARFLEENDR